MTTDLATVIGDVRGRIARHQKAGIGEQDTKAALIAPVLRALGWDLENLEDVKLEYRRRSIDNPVDYALFLLRTARLFIEAKSLGSRLDDGKWAAQVLSYATAAGVVWVALTDGDQWRIYNSHAAVPVEQKLFRVIRVSDPDAPVIETLGLLARSQMEDRLIDQLWATETVDRQVAKVLKRLFGPEPSPALVEVIRGEASALSDDDVRASLGRVVTTFDFPRISAPVGDAPHPAPPVARPRAAPTVPTVKPPTTDQPLSLASLIETGAITPPLIIEHRFRDRVVTATIEGPRRVVLDGVAFDSLSTAAGVARRTESGADPASRPPATNGWTFWRYRLPDGTSRDLDALRRGPGS